MNIDIIGAGIGGLTTANALIQKGFTVRIFDQASEMKPVGAGIILANNAMQVFNKLTLKEQIENKGNRISSMNITKADLSLISKIDLRHFEKVHKVKNIAIHRGILQNILLNKLNTSFLHLNHRLKHVERISTGYILHFENGKEYQSSVLIGADGINSIVRKVLFQKNKIRNAGQVCWRGVSHFNLPIVYKHELNEAWGKENRFGFVELGDNKVYWYALKSFDKSKALMTVNDISQYFKSYHPVIGEILASTDTAQIHFSEITDLKPTHKWYDNQVCLIGDAVHATTPNMGQGACQSIEDAYIISECLAKYPANEAFKKFQNLRKPKAHNVTNGSWTLGKVAHISNPILITLRNQIMRMTPSYIKRKQSRILFQLAKVS